MVIAVPFCALRNVVRVTKLKTSSN